MVQTWVKPMVHAPASQYRISASVEHMSALKLELKPAREEELHMSPVLQELSVGPTCTCKPPPCHMAKEKQVLWSLYS